MIRHTDKNFARLFSLLVAAGLLLLTLPLLFPLDGQAGSDWGIFLGRFHIVILHLPIAWLVLIPFVEFFARRMQRSFRSSFVSLLLFSAAISVFFTAIVGFTLASSEGYEGEIVKRHMWFGISTAVLTFVTLFSHQAWIRYKLVWLRQCYWALLTVTLILVSIAGHLGGSLVQGEGYLTEKLPVAVRKVLGEDILEKDLDEDTSIFVGFVQPILEKNCLSCHNSGKTKGGYNMASSETMFAGGKSGKVAITPGNLENSELAQRISLDANHESVMPPDGRTLLPDQEIAFIRWWISEGASLTIAYKDLDNEDLDKDVVLYLDQQLAAAAQSNDIDTRSITFAETDFIQVSDKLGSEYGIFISQVSQDLYDGLHVETFNVGKDLDTDAWKLLEKVSELIVSIDLAGIDISEDGMDGLSSFTNLKSLRLYKCEIPNNSLSKLKTLTGLKMLNLYGTPLTENNPSHLTELTRLQTLYVGETKIPDLAIAEMRSMFAQNGAETSIITAN